MTIRLFFLALLILLGARLFLFFSNVAPLEDESSYEAEVILFSQPQVKASAQSFSFITSEGHRIFVTTGLIPKLEYGDRLKIKGEINLSENKRYYISYPKINRIPSKGASFLAALSLFRQKIVAVFNGSLSQIDSALLLGIVFGIKQNMPEDFSNALRNTGLLHVIAASGMNVTLIGGFLLGLFSYFFKRQAALILTIFAIVLYSLLAGLEPSIVRAAIMGIIVFTAQVLGRQSLSLYSLFLAALLMLLFSPPLLFDLGFQLSFFATAGLILIKPRLSIKRLKPFPLFEDLTTTLSAQLATLPILLNAFGTYSVTSILANALILWIVPLIMVFGGIAALFSLFFTPLAVLILYLSIPLLKLFEWVALLFGHGPQISISFPPALAIGYYLILLSILMTRRRPEALPRLKPTREHNK